jgi:phage-related tail protein
MERSLADAQEKIAKLELEVEDLRTALNLIYEISQDRITPVWQVIEEEFDALIAEYRARLEAMR